MKTMELNFKMVMLLAMFIALSGLLVNGLFSRNDNPGSGNSYAVAPLSKENNPAPNNSVAAEKVKSAVNKTIDKVENTINVVSSEVKAFIPEFDDEWCKSKYPNYNGKISVASHELIIKDRKGAKITDYNELSLKLAPSGNDAKDLEKDYKFEDGYVDVKGIGPMKIKSVKFTFVQPSAVN